MHIEFNRSLLHLNTLGFNRTARHYCESKDTEALHDALAYAQSHQLPVRVLGSGSNIILTKDIDGLVIRQTSSSISHSAVPSNPHRVKVSCDAGVVWHDLVEYSLAHDLYGLENLSLIPGLVGAAPIQNIGAYGVELCDVIDRVSTIHIASGEAREFSASECQFQYRDSVFKSTCPGEYIITGLTLQLTINGPVNLSYAALAHAIEQTGIENPTARDVSNTVCAIRRSKLPDPSRLGNAGSFFKNPVISRKQFHTLRETWPSMPGHPDADNQVKVPAAWLIDQSGFKGQRFGPVGVHHQQALVLVHFGGGTGEELLKLASWIQSTIRENFGISLEIEPGII